MNVIGHKSYGHHLFSFNGVDESSKGRRRLSEFLRRQIQISEGVVCLCKRPLLNQSVKELIQDKGAVFSKFEDIRYDDFELSFSDAKSCSDNEIISLLADCFYFFEQPVFVFLNSDTDIVDCRKFYRENKDWKGITDNFESCFIFKSVEDDVVWYGVSPVQGATK